jgi:hypothetical protein
MDVSEFAEFVDCKIVGLTELGYACLGSSKVSDASHGFYSLEKGAM